MKPQRKKKGLTLLYSVCMLCLAGVMIDELLTHGTYRSVWCLIIPFVTFGYLLLAHLKTPRK